MNAAFSDIAPPIMRGQQSDIGKRPNQEDRWEIREFTTADGRSATLALVADGIGGHNTGEIASQMAKELIPAALLAKPPSASELTRRLKAALEETSQEIYRASLAEPERAGMGTTCTAIAIADRRLYLAHVGDSRAYLLRQGQLLQLTIDHTWAEEAIRAGRSPEEIRNHPNRGVILRYLGIDPSVSIDTRYRDITGAIADALDGPFYLEPGDTLLLCTDGVSDVLDHGAIAEFMAYPDCQAAADALVDAALKAGSNDNVTAVVLRLPGGVIVRPIGHAKAGKKIPLSVIILAAAGLLFLGSLVLVLSDRNNESGTTATLTPPPEVAQATQPPTVFRATSRPATVIGGGVQVATAAVTPARTVGPTVAPTLPVISSGTETAVTTAPGMAVTTGEPTIVPTMTPVPTGTPILTRPSPGGRFSPTPTTPMGVGGVELLQPPENEKIVDEATFSWRPTADLWLAPGEQYELIVWGEGEDPMRDGRSPTGATPKTHITANLAGVEGTLRLSAGKTYFWGVRLVGHRGSPIRMLSDGRRFVYERSGSGGTQGGIAPGEQ